MKIDKVSCFECLDKGCISCNLLSLSRRKFFFFGSLLVIKPQEIIIPKKEIAIPAMTVLFEPWTVSIDTINLHKLDLSYPCPIFWNIQIKNNK